jgi:hypothetical protein
LLRFETDTANKNKKGSRPAPLFAYKQILLFGGSRVTPMMPVRPLVAVAVPGASGRAL